MKRITTLTGLLLMMLFAASAFAQGHMDANERDVRIVEGPSINNVTDHSARIEWVTNSAGANQVRYRVAGSRDQWQSAYHQGGGTHHSLELSGLEPGRTYEWEIMTRDGDVRQKGTFQTEGHHRHSDNRNGYPGDRGCGGGDRGYGQRVTLYRSVSPVNGGHLYSTDSNDPYQRNFRMEGPAGYLLGQQRDGAVPLYRMSSSNGLDFLLTTDTNDMRRMERQFGYRDDGVIGYIATSQIPGTQPFYRLVKDDGSAHFFTANAEEREHILRQGWHDEGITGYIWPQ